MRLVVQRDTPVIIQNHSLCFSPGDDDEDDFENGDDLELFSAVAHLGDLE